MEHWRVTKHLTTELDHKNKEECSKYLPTNLGGLSSANLVHRTMTDPQHLPTEVKQARPHSNP